VSAIDEISEAIGALRAEVRNMADDMRGLRTSVEGLQKQSWMAKGGALVVAALSGAAGGKLAALLGMTPPGQP
jgi:hypothetical protein